MADTGFGFLMEELETLPIPIDRLPPGWMRPTDLNVLYTLARRNSGPILEIGSFVGRSTSAIAAGVRDGRGDGDRALFDTCDLGVTSPDEWNENLVAPWPSYERQPETWHAALSRGGVTGALIENLRRLQLLPYATSIIRGDQMKVPLRDKYGMVFCDTLHNETELDRYSDHLRSLLDENAVFVADDVVEDSEFSRKLVERLGLTEMFFTRSLHPYSKLAVARKG